jgi:site-specific DNA-methyltransferase (adenine-specific)
MEPSIELLLQDNLDFMRSQPDKAFDLVVADPWYGVGMTKDDTTGFAKRRFRIIERKQGREALEALEAFQDTAPPREYFDQVRRIGKKVFIWGGNYFGDILGTCLGPYIWDKATGANYFADGEMAWNNVLNCMRIFHHQWCGAFKKTERGEVLIHPCQKPVELYKDIYLRCKLKPGATIYDPNLGSGSSAIAAKDMGYNFVGTEIVKSYYDKTSERVKNHVAQSQLFKPEETYPELFEAEV